ncbi:MAG: PAS domain-containing sensor histidine kinase [Candidatus Xenobiia bacterium LiM19]
MHNSQDEHADKAIRLSEIRYRKLFEFAADSIVLIEKGLIVDCSRQALKLFGCLRDQMTGQGISRFSPQDQPDGRNSGEKAAEIIEAALQRGNLFLEWLFRREDGTLFDTEVTLTRIELEDEPLLMAALRDISSRRLTEAESSQHENDLERIIRERTALLKQEIERHLETERALSESEKRLRGVLDSMDALAYVADMETYEVLFFNQYGKNQWGDITGQICWQKLQGNQQGPCSFCTNKKLIDDEGHSTGVLVWEFQNTVNGRWYQCRDVAIPWVDGRLVRLEIASDITDLKSAMEQAESADRLKSAFLASMSHELRTPLNSIIGFTGILLQELSGPLNPEQAMQLGFIKESSAHLLKLINDILDISKIEAGQLQLEPQLFDLVDSVQRVIQMLKPLADNRNISLEAHIGPEVDDINGDQRRVEQILINLISNAIKFTKKGGVTVTCKFQNDLVQVSVTDTGIGISPENQKSLFKPFSQIISRLSSRSEGTGLGLSISQKIVNLMGGVITVESKVGQGSTFTATFLRDTGG